MRLTKEEEFYLSLELSAMELDYPRETAKQLHNRWKRNLEKRKWFGERWYKTLGRIRKRKP